MIRGILFSVHHILQNLSTASGAFLGVFVAAACIKYTNHFKKCNDLFGIDHKTSVSGEENFICMRNFVYRLLFGPR
jgi:hypothetical protein